MGDRNLAGMPPPSPHQHGTKKRWSVHDFTYRDAGWEKLFFDAVRNVNFSGVTVTIFEISHLQNTKYNFIFEKLPKTLLNNLHVCLLIL